MSTRRVFPEEGRKSGGSEDTQTESGVVRVNLFIPEEYSGKFLRGSFLKTLITFYVKSR